MVKNNDLSYANVYYKIELYAEINSLMNLYNGKIK